MKLRIVFIIFMSGVFQSIAQPLQIGIQMNVKGEIYLSTFDYTIPDIAGKDSVKYSEFNKYEDFQRRTIQEFIQQELTFQQSTFTESRYSKNIPPVQIIQKDASRKKSQKSNAHRNYPFEDYIEFEGDLQKSFLEKAKLRLKLYVDSNYHQIETPDSYEAICKEFSKREIVINKESSFDYKVHNIVNFEYVDSKLNTIIAYSDGAGGITRDQFSYNPDGQLMHYFKKKIGEAGGESISFDYDEKGRVNLAIVASHGYYFDSYGSISIVYLLYFQYDNSGFLKKIIKNFEGHDFVSNVEIY